MTVVLVFKVLSPHDSRFWQNSQRGLILCWIEFSGTCPKARTSPNTRNYMKGSIYYGFEPNYNVWRVSSSAFPHDTWLKVAKNHIFLVNFVQTRGFGTMCRREDTCELSHIAKFYWGWCKCVISKVFVRSDWPSMTGHLVKNWKKKIEISGTTKFRFFSIFD